MIRRCCPNDNTVAAAKISKLRAGSVIGLMLIAGMMLVARPSVAEDPALDEAIRSYILEHPEVIIEAIEKYQLQQRAEQEQQAALAIEAHRDALERDSMSPVAGNPDGDVVVVEFFDYQCGYCKRVVPAIQKLLEDDPNIRYVFKEFPVLGEASLMASRAALAVWLLDRDMYAPFHFELMSARGTLTEERVLDIASEIGADRAAIAETMKDDEVTAMVERNMQLAQSINVRGTPAFLIGGTLVPGAIDLETMRNLVENARAS